jgi:hypothetical protein
VVLDPSAFVEKLTNEMIEAAPPDVQVHVVSSQEIQEQLAAFQRDVLEGLQRVLDGGDVSDLGRVLRERKTEIVARAQAHNFTLERLVARAIDSTLEAARDARQEGTSHG